MASDRSVLERQIERVELRPLTLDGFHRRRQRKDRNRRIGTAVVALLVAGATFGGLLRALSSHSVPADYPTPRPTASGAMWPQTSLEEVRRAQELADAGDPRYTWQRAVSGIQVAQNHPKGAELFVRFLKEKLGWEAFLWDEAFAHPDGLNPGDVIYVRCAPGLANPLYPADTERPGCAPTIDERRTRQCRRRPPTSD
jgi:hypothetical protein